MSEAISIGVIAEGPTDFIALQSILKAILGEQQPFTLTRIRPQKTEGLLGGSTDASQPLYTQKGWSGVHNWCQEISSIPQAKSLIMHQILILHLDVDVSGFTYDSAGITPRPDYLALPCNRQCPPASDSADALINVAKSWLYPVTPSSHWIWCCPSHNMETWAYTAWNTQQARSKNNLECAQDIPGRVKKREREYINRYAPSLEASWDEVRNLCPLAQRFTTDILLGVGAILAS